MTGRNWIAEEFARASERVNQLPPHAKPVVTKPLMAGRGRKTETAAPTREAPSSGSGQ
jgi:hypothetical protein